MIKEDQEMRQTDCFFLIPEVDSELNYFFFLEVLSLMPLYVRIITGHYQSVKIATEY